MKTCLFICVAILATVSANYLERVRPLVESIFDACDKTGNGGVGKDELESFFSQYSGASDITFDFEINQADFCEGDKNFAGDFNLTSDECSVVFRLLDVKKFGDLENVTSTEQTISNPDLDILYEFADQDEDGELSEEEWNEAMFLVLRPWSPGMLHKNYEDEEGTGNYDAYIGLLGWIQMFEDICGEGNTFCTLTEVVDFWTEKYGSQLQGTALFFLWDWDQDGFLTYADWDEMYFRLDDRNDGVLYFNNFAYQHDSRINFPVSQ